MAEKEKHYLSLSVHELVDFLLRRGDIDSRVYNSDTMALGSKLHSSFQKRQGMEYLSEVPLKETFERPLGNVTVEGRADGIIVGGPFPVIDEIKTTVAKLEDFYASQKEWHLGQAMVYAYIYGKSVDAEKVGIRLTYISQIDNSQMEKDNVFSIDELREKVEGLVDEYLSFYAESYEHTEKRNLSAASLPFPFSSFRLGQREMARYVYGAASKGGYFFCEAPTGIGKTMSALYPSVKSFANGKTKKIFYLTAKATGAEAAYKAIGRLKEKGLEIRDSSLKSKEKMCLKKGAQCNPDDCPFAKGYYDKLRNVIGVAASSNERFSSDYVISLSKRYAMCPFELQLDLSLWSDIIVADYNYFFDPLVHLERYFDETVDSSEYFLLVDEAHNLVDRSRSMYSEEISLSTLLKAKRSIRSLKFPSLKRALSKIEKALLEEEDEREDAVLESVPPKLVKALTSFNEFKKKLNKSEHPKLPDAISDFSRECYRFSFLLENYSTHSSVFKSFSSSRVSIHLYCLDPSEYLKDDLSRVKGAVFFSGTLSPISYYIHSILGEDEAPYLLLPSPFPKENFHLLLAPKTSTRYKDRGKTYEEVAKYLKAFVDSHLGNYFIFFPSYDYLEKISPFLSFSDARVYSQSREMGDEEKLVFLSHFIVDPKITSVGLLIIGGSFSEGIDLIGNRLFGVAVVGVGLPQISFERNLIRDYFASSDKGYEYAYMDPGINKVMQALGRLIRSETDKGAALLIDDRYMRNDYRELFQRLYPEYEVLLTEKETSPSLNLFYKKAGL